MIAPDVTDIVSHVAVRARNARLLFATCYDSPTLARLKLLHGHQLEVRVTLSGDVAFKEIAKAAPASRPKAPSAPAAAARPQFTKFAITSEEFGGLLVGAKSLNQKLLRENLPDWIRVPESAAIPFGVFEEVLNWKENKSILERCRQLSRSLEQNASPTKTLEELRSTINQLQAPDAMAQAFAQALKASHLTPPQCWDDAWNRIRRVWASKWNERAYFSRRTMGMAHEHLFMAVLIQPMVPAEYAFVIHTANPITGERGELLAEIVLGLGEALVGNYAGRALSFVADKQSRRHRLLSYPSKSIGLYGNGLIFR
ncbi:MAG: hypothetical protein KGJ60_08150 [Verrucomicrobiota bacterium]|nr:hypothetical protein [Verrucomicrobiota bacterium]